MKFRYVREDGVVTTTNIWYSTSIGKWRWTCTNENTNPYTQFSGQDVEFFTCYQNVLECIANI